MFAPGPSCPVLHSLPDSHCEHYPIQYNVWKQGPGNAGDVDNFRLLYHMAILLECLFYYDLSDHIMILNPWDEQIAECIELPPLEHTMLEEPRMNR